MKVFLPGEHAEESVDDLSCEGNPHLDSQCLKQRQEEGQHLIRHIWEREVTINKAGQLDNFLCRNLLKSSGIYHLY